MAFSLCLTLAVPGQHEGDEHAKPHGSQPSQPHTSTPHAGKQGPNTTAGRAIHSTLPKLPPLFAWKYVKMGNEAFVAAKKNEGHKESEHARPKLLPRPAGAGRYVCAVIACADADIEIAPLLGLRRRDVFILRVPGPYVSQESVAILDRLVDKQHLSLILVLSHDQCQALAPAAKGKPGDALDRRRETLQRVATRTRQSLRDALLHRQRELLLASSTRMRTLRHKDELRIVPGVIQTRTGAIEWRHRRVQELPMSPVK